jgi:hypothetical protein
MPFHVVFFPGENTVDAVPMSWYFADGTCAYPVGKKGASLDAKNEKMPGLDWKKYPARVMGTYGETYMQFSSHH